MHQTLREDDKHIQNHKPQNLISCKQFWLYMVHTHIGSILAVEHSGDPHDYDMTCTVCSLCC